MFEKPASANELRALGLTYHDLGQVTVEIWPDNVDTVNTFIAMATQWRVGYAGPIGLDYASLPSVMDFLGIATDDRKDVFEGIRIMERAALDEMNRED